MRLPSELFFLLLIAVFNPVIAEDLYKVLGIKKNADLDEIKSAYKKLAIKYHPDKTKGNKKLAEKFLQATKAYETLKDPQKKRMYDMTGNTSGEEGMGFAPFDGQTFTFTWSDNADGFGFGNADNGNGGGGGNGRNNKKGGSKKQSGGQSIFDHLFQDDMFYVFDDEPHGFGGGDSFFGNHFFAEGGPRDNRDTRHPEGRFQQKERNCRTVTQQVGNTITTYTECF